ncbi:hypothetical protein EP47_12235 [Legionella norrlandica]|uniref:Diaminobutyrate-2-oxoglutarate aminotransferase n=1 Tax=Legionella norrlandica TaxID=1498499 RepID=A0A0A2SUX8_9GAMM|nr:elongation factor P hydroxylase [Legionella norrlandica]KGP63541.1 hypothetical protein EP47_12235 [Legionella norrlandica]
MHNYQDLIRIFNDCFEKDYNTRLVKGGDEPIYLPADEQYPYNALFFAHGFFSSALHECAHWLIAGEERRKLVDFGYWYAPDGRTQEQQALFQKMEVKPQAMEWILSVATGHKFRVSIDNLNGTESDTEAFKQSIHNQVLHYCTQGLSQRAQRFRNALCAFYKRPISLKIDDFLIDEL